MYVFIVRCTCVGLERGTYLFIDVLAFVGTNNGWFYGGLCCWLFLEFNRGLLAFFMVSFFI